MNQIPSRTRDDEHELRPSNPQSLRSRLKINGEKQLKTMDVLLGELEATLNNPLKKEKTSSTMLD